MSLSDEIKEGQYVIFVSEVRKAIKKLKETEMIQESLLLEIFGEKLI